MPRTVQHLQQFVHYHVNEYWQQRIPLFDSPSENKLTPTGPPHLDGRGGMSTCTHDVCPGALINSKPPQRPTNRPVRHHVEGIPDVQRHNRKRPTCLCLVPNKRVQNRIVPPFRIIDTRVDLSVCQTSWVSL